MIKKYALVFFFLLSYLFTWSNWLPQALTSRGIASIEVPGLLTLVSGYGPALAGWGKTDLPPSILRTPTTRYALVLCPPNPQLIWERMDKVLLHNDPSACRNRKERIPMS